MTRPVCAVAALLLAAISVMGRLSPAADAFASFLPFALPLAVVALVPWHAKPRPAVVAVAGLAIVVAIPGMAPEFRNRPARHGTDADLTLVTHNVSVANSDPDATIVALIKSDADILLLQETDGALAPHLWRLSKVYPYRNRCAAGCSLAIFSRLPMARVRYKFRTSAGKAIGPPLQQTQVRLPDGSMILVATIHLPWPLPVGPQERMLDSLAETVAKADRSRLILAGDFNLTPWSQAMRDLDSALDPMRRATRSAWSFPAHVGAVPIFPMLPIDHVFVGPEWEIVRVERLARTGSDHYPLRIALRTRGAWNKAGSAGTGRSSAQGDSE